MCTAKETTVAGKNEKPTNTNSVTNITHIINTIVAVYCFLANLFICFEEKAVDGPQCLPHDSRVPGSPP